MSGELTIEIASLPNDGGRPVTETYYTLDGGPLVPLGLTAPGQFVITGLVPSQTYSVVVYAQNSIGVSPVSDIKLQAATSVPATAPSAFLLSEWALTDPASGGALDVTISSLPSDGGSAITDIEYRVNTGSWVPTGGTGNFSISGLTDDVPYTIYIRAVNAIGAGATGSSKVGIPTAPAVILPDAFADNGWEAYNIGATAAALIAVLTLPADNGVSITDVEYQIDGGSWVSSAGLVDFNIEGLVNTTSYSFKVRAVNANGPGPESNAKVVLIEDVANYHALTIGDLNNGQFYGYADAPIGDFDPDNVGGMLPVLNSLRASGSGTLILDNNDDVRWSELQRITCNFPSYTGRGTFTLIWLSSNNEYYNNSSSGERGYMASRVGLKVPVYLEPLLEAPETFDVADWSVADTAAGGELQITINALPLNRGATITDVEYQLDNGSWVSSGGTATFTITGLTDSQAYDVALRAVNSVGAGDKGDVKTATPTAAPVNTPDALTAGQWGAVTGGGANVIPFDDFVSPTASGGVTQVYSGFTTVPGINVFAVYAASLASPYTPTFTVDGNAATVRVLSTIAWFDGPLYLVEYDEQGAGGAAVLSCTWPTGTAISRTGAAMWQLGSGFAFVAGSDIDGGADYGTGYSDPLLLTPPNTQDDDVILMTAFVSDGGYVEGDASVVGLDRKDVDNTYQAGRFMVGGVLQNALAGATVGANAGLSGNATYFGCAGAWRKS